MIPDGAPRAVVRAPRTRGLRLGAGAAVVVAIVAIAVGALVTSLAPRGDSRVVEASGVGQPTTTASESAARGILFVHVVGAVERPGLYELSEGARILDAIAAAGGYTETADQSQLNLARAVSDGEQVRVPAVGEVPAGAAGSTADGRVNINTADAAVLDTLPRVGPAMAERIIRWREANGPFASVDDLMSVSGIGQKTFEGLRDLVTT